MFGALRDCAPQLLKARHVDDEHSMVEAFKEEIMNLLKEVAMLLTLSPTTKETLH